MVGSRLLFSGYGRGFRSRPLHAGFIGQDALLVHDEAHLEPAFQRLIEAVEAEQERCHEFRRLRPIAVTATTRAAGSDLFRLTEADRNHPEIQQRIEAKKGAAFYATADEKKIPAEIFERALGFKDSGQAILIFLKRVEDVQETAGKLRKLGFLTTELTGTIRGYERDQMTKTDDVFARFSPEMEVTPATGTVFLVCTSAGEVGINISADHLVCDLATFESMAQRLGRVNRFGGGDAQVEIVYADENDERRKRTLDLLKKLPLRSDGRHNASPAALDTLPPEERHAAFSPPPEIPATSEFLFDAWALTSVRGNMPGRPPVAPWLHGIEKEGDPAEVHVAWREEVKWIGEALQDAYPPEDLLDDFPLKPHEWLRDVETRVVKQFKRIVERLPDTPMWLVDPEGNVRTGKLADLLPGDKTKRPVDLANCTVLLSPSAGGLTETGMLDGSAEYKDTRAYDVADRWTDEQNHPRRCRCWDSSEVPDGMRQVRAIDLMAEAEGESGESAALRRYWRWYVRPQSADDDGSWNSRHEQELHAHATAAERFATDLVARLSLNEIEASAVVHAAKWHDLGKSRRLWQRWIGNFDAARTLAKSANVEPRFRSDYRHELGSLIDVLVLPEFGALPPEVQDLTTHIIAAHHGRARPHFAVNELFDPDSSYGCVMDIGRETPRRFARLQRKYGRWGLAYLESLVRAADALASATEEPSQPAKIASAGGER